MRIAPELSLSRVNQAGWNGPLLLSEPISKNEAKMTLRRRKWGTFYRKGYVARYGATPLILSCCDNLLQNGLFQAKRLNSTSLNRLRQKPDFNNSPKPRKT
jgi:hypothetical protein